MGLRQPLSVKPCAFYPVDSPISLPARGKRKSTGWGVVGSDEVAEVWSLWERGLFSPRVNRLGKSRETCIPTHTFLSDPSCLPFSLCPSLGLKVGLTHLEVMIRTNTHRRGEFTPLYLWTHFPRTRIPFQIICTLFVVTGAIIRYSIMWKSCSEGVRSTLWYGS